MLETLRTFNLEELLEFFRRVCAGRQTTFCTLGKPRTLADVVQEPRDPEATYMPQLDAESLVQTLRKESEKMKRLDLCPDLDGIVTAWEGDGRVIVKIRRFTRPKGNPHGNVIEDSWSLMSLPDFYERWYGAPSQQAHQKLQQYAAQHTRVGAQLS